MTKTKIGKKIDCIEKVKTPLLKAYQYDIDAQHILPSGRVIPVPARRVVVEIKDDFYWLMTKKSFEEEYYELGYSYLEVEDA